MSAEVSESDEDVELIEIELDFALCRTFGAHFNSIHYPDVTVGPIIFRPYGPDAQYISNPRLFCNSLFRSSLPVFFKNVL